MGKKTISWTELECAYFAGALDVGGSVSCFRTRKTCYPQISFTDSNSKQMAWLAAKLGCSISVVKSGFFIRVHGERAIKLAERLLPYVIARKQQLLLVVDFPIEARGVRLEAQPHVTKLRERLRSQINKFNHRAKNRFYRRGGQVG